MNLVFQDIDIIGFLSRGGVVLFILVLLSLVMVTLAIVKGLQLFRCSNTCKNSVNKALDLVRKGDFKESYAIFSRIKLCPVARIAAESISELNKGELSLDLLREKLNCVAKELTDNLESWLKVFSSVGVIAPLLGLMGTVTGMIGAFMQISSASDQVSPSLLAGGIWEALLTTAAGLIVAIPSLALSHWYESIVDSICSRMESVVSEIFVEWNRSKEG